MTETHAFPPTFEPGSGWYRIGAWAPGSASDVAARRAAAFRCVVFRMRNRSGKLPASEVAATPPVSGCIVCSDAYTWPRWHAELLELPDLKRQLLRLHDARLVRLRGGFRQYQGSEYDERALEQWPQTWFCAPNEAAGVAVLQKMAA